MALTLAGKSALITGASRGIGRAIAVEFAREGANVVINYARRADEAETAATEVRQLGRQAIIHQADTGHRQQQETLFEAGLRAFGRLDIVVANAAFSVRKPLLDLTVNDVERTWAVSSLGRVPHLPAGRAAHG